MLRNLRSLEDLAGDPAQFKATLAKISANLQAHESEMPKTITAVEQLLAAGTPVPTSPEMLAEAAARCQKAQAPAAHFKKSSINDCVIWQVLMSELRKHDHLIFCTNNSSDFSDPKHQLKLHPELGAEIDGYHDKMCYHTLEGFLEKHIKTVERVVTLNRLAGEPYQDCPACGSPLDGGLTAHPSQIGGGWSLYHLCRKCGTQIDTGIPADD